MIASALLRTETERWREMYCLSSREWVPWQAWHDTRLWETRLWDGLCEKHAYERRAYGMAAYKRHAFGMVYGRCTPIECPSIGDILISRRCL
jgi:hypothetical protein